MNIKVINDYDNGLQEGIVGTVKDAFKTIKNKLAELISQKFISTSVFKKFINSIIPEDCKNNLTQSTQDMVTDIDNLFRDIYSNQKAKNTLINNLSALVQQCPELGKSTLPESLTVIGPNLLPLVCVILLYQVGILRGFVEILCKYSGMSDQDKKAEEEYKKKLTNQINRKALSYLKTMYKGDYQKIVPAAMSLGLLPKDISRQ